jgi:hypothetical protein
VEIPSHLATAAVVSKISEFDSSLSMDFVPYFFSCGLYEECNPPLDCWTTASNSFATWPAAVMMLRSVSEIFRRAVKAAYI